jgi:hypothetical protein
MAEKRSDDTTTGFRERRTGQNPIPDHLDSLLTELQRVALWRLEPYGWKVHFVRCPPFLAPVVVLVDGTGHDRRVLREDGELDYATDLKIRE